MGYEDISDCDPFAFRGKLQHEPCHVKETLFSEENDSVRVGAARVIVHTPAIGGLGKLLIINQHKLRLQAGVKSSGQDCFFEPGFSAMDFADLEGDVAARFKDTMKFAQDFSHRGAPL